MNKEQGAKSQEQGAKSMEQRTRSSSTKKSQGAVHKTVTGFQPGGDKRLNKG